MSKQIPTLRGDEPLMVFGGPYSNLEATRAVLDEATRLSISADRIICTGDVVAYGADAAATVDLVRDRVSHVVMGNCEENLAAGSDDCGCGFPTGSSCERLSAHVVCPRFTRVECRCAGLDGQFAAANQP
jgi:hypothetical protein